MFTFSFGTAMAYSGSGYTLAEAQSIIDNAYQNATATTFEVDYNTTDSDANDITVFTVDKAYVQAGIYAAYQAYKTALTGSNITSIAGVTLVDGESLAVDTAKVKLALETAAVTGGAYVNDTLEAAFDAYKAELVSIVNSISTDDYTTTNYEDLGLAAGFTAKNGVTYDTSKEAAEADKQWALDAIAKAKFSGSGTDSASTTATWNTTYENLYAKVFGEVFTMTLNKDDLAEPTKVTSVSYEMKNSAYSTTAAEKQSSATLAVQKAQKKAELVSIVTTFEVGSSYKASYANAIAAYQEAMEYLIDTAAKVDELPTLGTAITAATATTVKIDSGSPVDYVKISSDAAKAKADAANNKQIASIVGKYYDDTKADAALVVVLREVYKNNAYTSSTQTANGKQLYAAVGLLTAGEKAALKAAKDYSDVEADANGKYTFKTYNTTTLADAVYYEKEFEAVKAAADAYCAAIDAATTQLDVDKAEAAYKEATLEKNIKKAESVEGIFTSYTNGMLSAYWTKVQTNSGVSPIYVTWNGGDSYVTAYSDNDFKAFAIAKGARTTKEADALFAEACAVIDAYKTKAQLTNEAAAAQAKIAALPTTVTLADKAAVVEAYDTYMAVAEQFRGFVANTSTLKKAVAALEKLEAVEVIKLVNALPAQTKVTVADKAAVKAANDAYDAWLNEDAYKDTAMVASRTAVTDPSGYKTLVKTAELQAIKDAYAPLAAKYSVDKLTAADAADVKALQEAVAAYIAEYSEAVPNEDIIAKMAAVVATDDENAKAYVQDLGIKARSTKTAKGVKVTIKADVQELLDAGFTVEYKFYRSTKSNKGFKAMITKTTGTYTNTKGVKGTKYYYKAKLVVKNAEGEVVATTPLTQCLYATRTF